LAEKRTRLFPIGSSFLSSQNSRFPALFPTVISFRKALFWLHLAVGVTAGIVILSMTVSGLLIVYEKQVTAWAEHGARRVEVPEGVVRLEIETLLAKVREARPEARVIQVVAYADPAAATQISLPKDEILFADPYTGKITGYGNKTLRGVVQFIIRWHRWFALEGKGKEIGENVTGAAALAFFGLTLTGLFLWMPKRWSWRSVKTIIAFDSRLTGKNRDWNWHNVIGFWCAPVLLLVTSTGAIMAYPWANDLLYKMAGTEPPPRRKAEASGGRREREAAAPDWTGLNPLWASAEKQVPGWNFISHKLGSGPSPAVFIIDRGNGARPDLRAQLTLNRETGAVEKWETYESLPRGRQWRNWVRWLHTGEAGGWVGQTIALLAAAGGAVLVWTGLALSWRRFFGRGKAEARSKE
jgi:uncharacterized iron-regulated membrane protein